MNDIFKTVILLFLSNYFIVSCQTNLPEQELRARVQSAELVNESEKFLQEVWNSIEVQQKYLISGMWPSGEFNMI
jgi:hypothetical protein